MNLTPEHIAAYEQQGFVVIENLLSEAEIALLQAEVPTVFAYDYPGRVFEKHSGVVRAIHGPHLFNELFGRLARLPRLLSPAMQLLGGPVYIHQYKINAKAAFEGEIWKWHQDYQFWRDEDGLMTAQVINAAIFVDEVHEFNGPLIVVPGSHTEGLIEMAVHTPATAEADAERPWLSAVSADLKLTIDQPTLRRLVAQHGMVAPKGPRGSVLFFHPNIVHGSAPNMSPHDRTLVVITYNSVANQPRPVASPRPEFMAGRDYTPLEPLAEDTLLPVAATRAP